MKTRCSSAVVLFAILRICATKSVQQPSCVLKSHKIVPLPVGRVPPNLKLRIIYLILLYIFKA